MGSLSKEKIEKIQISYDAKKEKESKNNIIFNNQKKIMYYIFVFL